jgi:hypothetical protein
MYQPPHDPKFDRPAPAQALADLDWHIDRVAKDIPIFERNIDHLRREGDEGEWQRLRFIVEHMKTALPVTREARASGEVHAVCHSLYGLLGP